MMMNIISQEQLVLEMNKISENVIDNVANKALIQLQNDIDRDTYLYDYWPNKFYFMGMRIPTFQFKRAWKLDDMKKDVTSRIRELFYDYTSMSFDPDNYLHGSARHGDRREQLASDLNVSGISPSADFGKERQPYWDHFIQEMFDNGQLQKWFDEELSIYGFTKS